MEEKQLQNFPFSTLRFLEKLEQNNQKAWFEAHRDEYEEAFLKPAQAFVEKLGKEIHKRNPGFIAIPKVDKSIFRIYRDIRFSKNKQPYKTHLGIFIWEGNGKKLESSGFYFHAEPKNVMMAVGLHMFSKDQLSAYRRVVSNEKKAGQLSQLLQSIQQTGYELGGKTYKKIPHGFEKSGLGSDLLLYSGLYAWKDYSPLSLHKKNVVDEALLVFEHLLPLHNWLRSKVY